MFGTANKLLTPADANALMQVERIGSGEPVTATDLIGVMPLLFSRSNVYQVISRLVDKGYLSVTCRMPRIRGEAPRPAYTVSS